jgi:hypothetical protein
MKTKKKTETLSDVVNMTPKQKNAFADRLTEQLLAAEKNVEAGKKPEDVQIEEFFDFETYTHPLSIYDENGYSVRKYKVHEDIGAQFGAHIDALVRLDEMYKLSLLIDSGDIKPSNCIKIMKDVLFSPGNVQGKVTEFIKSQESKEVSK